MTTATSQGEAHEVAKENKKAIQARNLRTGVLFTAPALIVLAIFVFYPAIQTFITSLTNGRINSNARRPAKFIGFQNYISLFQSQDFWTDVKNTLVYAVLYAPIVVIIALAFALLLNRKDLKFVGFFRTCMFLPFVISLTVAAIAWQFILSPSLGLIPYWVSLLGGPSHLDLLGTRETSMATVVFITVWKNFGYFMVIFLAGLQGISAELYEAASLDGASAWQKFRYITLPALRPTFNYVVIFGLIGSFQVFDQVFILTSGGPARSTETIVYRIYTEAFGNGKLGYASALSYVLLIMTLIVGLIQLYTNNKHEKEEIAEHRNRNLHETDRGTGIRKRSHQRRKRTSAQAGARAKRTISLTLSYVALALVTFLMIFPLIIVVIVSFTPNAVTQTWPPKIIPSAWTLDNYTSLFQRLPIGRELLNTIVFAGAVTIISVFFDSLAAYGLSRVDFKGRGILLAVLIATMMIPAMALLIPVYKLLGSMGLVNSYLGIIIPRMADVGGIFLLRQFFISIPKDLDNAARIDGAGEFRIFAQIILPNAVPAILTVGMFNFMGNWNDLLWPLIMTSKPETRTITAGLAMLTGHGSSVTPYGVVMAGALISALPLLIVFFFVQKRFVEGIAMTGMK